MSTETLALIPTSLLLGIRMPWIPLHSSRNPIQNGYTLYETWLLPMHAPPFAIVGDTDPDIKGR